MDQKTLGMVVLDPTVAPIPVDAKPATRPETLNGKRLGLLDNHKRNARELLNEMQRLLEERFEFASVVKRTKNDVSRPCPDDIIEDIAAQADVVITAIGD